VAGKSIADAVSTYGASLKPKLSNPAIGGQPEDQLRGPLDVLVKELAFSADTSSDWRGASCQRQDAPGLCRHGQ
jgi:hypothetical protein